MGDLETTVAAPFIHSHSSALARMQLIFYYTQEKHWMDIDSAKKLITLAVSLGYYTANEKGEYVLSESIRPEKIPLGFKPTDAIFTADVPEPVDPVEGVMHAVAAATGRDIKPVAAELAEIKNRFDALICDEAAAILLARKYNVVISQFQAELLKNMEK